MSSLDGPATRDAVHVAGRVGHGDELDSLEAGEDPGVASHHPEARSPARRGRTALTPVSDEVVDGRRDVLEVAVVEAGMDREGEDLAAARMVSGRWAATAKAGSRCVGTR